MNVYEVRLMFNAGPMYIAAGSFEEVATMLGGDAMSISYLGGLSFSTGEETAKAVSGGRQLTEEEIKATITEDGQYLISLENGKKYRSLKKHLTSAGLTPDQYRAKWGLPDIYPMNSVAYSIKRRDMALAAGLGKGKKK